MYQWQDFKFNYRTGGAFPFKKNFIKCHQEFDYFVEKAGIIQNNYGETDGVTKKRVGETSPCPPYLVSFVSKNYDIYLKVQHNNKILV